MARPRKIVAIGGGFGFSPPGSGLDAYILELSGRDRPNVLFLPTPQGDADTNIVGFYERFATRAEASHLKLFGAPDEAMWRPRLLAQDVILVSGGNTANALAVWRAHGVDRALREAWEGGTVMGGASAGMICWFGCSVTDSFGPRLAPLRDGLGFLPGSACPHYDSEALRRPLYRELVAQGLPGGYAADDGVGLYFEGTGLQEAVTEVDGRAAYRVEMVDGAVRETKIPARLLP
ncbi:MAG: Type 1 glutamine amidotransferase-like domain-containing protein [Candidatus Dormibacteraceae bacterium]